jgi:hypothetical protein
MDAILEADRQGLQDRVVELAASTGGWLIESGDRLDRFLDVWVAEGRPSAAIRPEHIREFQHRLRTQGWTRAERALARELGIDEAQLAQIRDALLAVDPDDAAGDFLAAGRQLAAAYREYGLVLR